MPIELIEDAAGLLQVAPLWDRLVRERTSSTPFELPAWMLTWWAHFGGGRPHTLVFGDEGLLPCFLHDWQGRRQLTLIGTGVSDWTDPPLSSAHIPELNRHLSAFDGWDVLDWQDLSAEHPLRAMQGAEVRPDTICSEVTVTGNFEDYWRARSKDLRRNIRRYRDKAEQTGRIAFATSNTAELMPELIRLHGMRWREQGQAGMVAANRSGAFLREVAAKFAELGMLRMFSLRFNDDWAALIVAFVWRNRVFSYLSAFDPELGHYGFGKLLLFEAMRHCFEQGYAGWNFLRGDEPYKASWGAVPISKMRLYKVR